MSIELDAMARRVIDASSSMTWGTTGDERRLGSCRSTDSCAYNFNPRGGER